MILSWRPNQQVYGLPNVQAWLSQEGFVPPSGTGSEERVSVGTIYGGIVNIVNVNAGGF